MALECTPPLPGRALMETWSHRNDDNNILLIAGLKVPLRAPGPAVPMSLAR